MPPHLLIALSLLSFAALAADDKAPPPGPPHEAKDVTKFCYVEGKEYSKGYRIVDQTKAVLVCDEEQNNFVSVKDPERLEWRPDNTKMRTSR
ncbi:MAG: hypothetical protein AB1642_13385 [Pseudomonadota bacterium]